MGQLNLRNPSDLSVWSVLSEWLAEGLGARIPFKAREFFKPAPEVYDLLRESVIQDRFEPFAEEYIDKHYDDVLSKYIAKNTSADLDAGYPSRDELMEFVEFEDLEDTADEYLQDNPSAVDSFIMDDLNELHNSVWASGVSVTGRLEFSPVYKSRYNVNSAYAIAMESFGVPDLLIASVESAQATQITGEILKEIASKV